MPWSGRVEIAVLAGLAIEAAFVAMHPRIDPFDLGARIAERRSAMAIPVDAPQDGARRQHPDQRAIRGRTVGRWGRVPHQPAGASSRAAPARSAALHDPSPL